MTTVLLASAIFATTTQVHVVDQATVRSNSSLTQRNALAVAVTWTNCAQYINAHSTYISPGAMTRLQNEVSAGVATWGIFYSEPSQSKTKCTSGGNVGWVDEEYVEFSSEQEANTAAGMLMQATIANGS